MSFKPNTNNNNKQKVSGTHLAVAESAFPRAHHSSVSGFLYLSSQQTEKLFSHPHTRSDCAELEQRYSSGPSGSRAAAPEITGGALWKQKSS